MGGFVLWIAVCEIVFTYMMKLASLHVGALVFYISTCMPISMIER